MKLPNFNIVSKSEAKSIGYSYRNPYNYAIQILSPDDGRFPNVCPNHLRLVFSDITHIDPRYPNDVIVTRDDIIKIREFSKSIPLHETLFHCFAGISRSTAASIIALSAQHEDVSQFVREFYTKFPHARPNNRMLEIGAEFNNSVASFNIHS